MILVFDTETSDTWHDDRPDDHPSQPRLVSLAAIAFSEDGKQEINSFHLIIKPEGFVSEPGALKAHGITTEFSTEHGVNCKAALHMFMHFYWKCRLAMTFNWQFDNNVIRRECAVQGVPMDWLDERKGRCVMLAASAAMKMPNRYGYASYAWPKLGEAYEWLFHKPLEGAHNSFVDAQAAGYIAFGMRDLQYWDIEKSS